MDQDVCHDAGNGTGSDAAENLAGNFKNDHPDNTYYSFDESETITVSSDDREPDDVPLYQNQEDDPAVQELIYQDYIKYFMWLTLFTISIPVICTSWYI